MAQPNFKDPIVSVGPTLTGTGNGTLTVDKLTHFTTAQDYTLTCIAKSPDTIFSIAGSLDGPVGLVKVGTQFFDEDLKIFLTIQQGFTPFEVGDKFELSVINGTDLNQDNIDDYDEQPQKNFGEGVKGTLSGDNNIRYSDDDSFSELYLQGLKFIAATAGSAGDDIQIQYLDFIPGTQASGTIGDLSFQAVNTGVAGNAITIQYLDYTPPVKAQRTIQDLTYIADNAGTGGNAISIRYTTGAVAGSEVVSVISNAITVQIESGVSTATQIKAAVDAFGAAAALVDVSISGVGSNFQTGPVSATSLLGGAAAVGDFGNEVVSVVGSAITVRGQNGFTTATGIKAKLDLSGPASALITTSVSGVGSNTQAIPHAPQALTGGVDAIGEASPSITVVSTLIKAYINSGTITAQQIKSAIEGSAPATALISVELNGPGNERQHGPVSPTNLSGGNSKFYALNKHELTEAGDFFEGNASLLAEDATLAGRLTVAGESDLGAKVILSDAGSASIPDLQQYVNWLVQDNKLTLRIANNTKLAWSAPSLSFTDDIIVDFTDTDFTNTIDSSASPISLTDGQSIYVILDRTQSAVVTAIVANTVPAEINAFRFASRFGDALILWDNTLVRNGQSVRIGEGGGAGAGAVRIDLYDPVDTSLPSGPSTTIDGVAVTNGMLVLFSNLSSGNNRIYSVAGVGTSMVWTAESAFSSGADPVLGDQVLPLQGEAFALSQGTFDGTDFKFNDVVRFFNGTDYWELSSINTQTLTDSTTGNVFTVAYVGSENMIIDYSIIRGARKEAGSIHVTTDGTSVAVTTTGAYIGLAGVTFFGDISAGNLRIRYTTDNSGGSSTMKYFVKRWSDNAGGPGGIPSYSGSGGSGVTAAGADTQIQYNDSGALGADSDFTWDDTSNTLQIGGLEVSGLSTVTLNDNVASPTTAFQYNATNYRYAIIEYSILRDGNYQVGRLLIANNGSIASISNDSVSTGATGITLLATITAGNVVVQYMSTSTTFNAQLKYSMRKWS